ncbi:MAG: GntR family transcriptional regulator [Alphaproteobacteria bacterium]
MDRAPQHKSQTARIGDLLRELIVGARYAPGQKLRIDDLCSELEGSSSAVREALSRLTAEGLVVALPQKGFVVAPISRHDLIDLTEVRVHIEQRCLEQSIRAGDIEWEGRILSIRHRFLALSGAYKKAGSPEARRWHQLHQQFHDELTSGCANRWWRRLRRQLYMQSERYRRLSGPFADYDRDVDGEHRTLADAVLARDVKQATALITNHLRTTTDILLASSMEFSDDETPSSQAATAG